MVGEPGLVEVDPGQWDDLLEGLGITDLYYSRGFVAASALLGDAAPVLLHLAAPGGDVVLPCLVRSDPCDVVTPYGYGGPLGAGPSAPLDAFAAAYEAWCTRRGAITSFFVYHPLLANQPRVAPPGFHTVALAGTVAWPLAQPDLLASMHAHHRRMVRRARARGLVTRVQTAPTHLRGFVDVYEATMRRANASPFYSFPQPYWDALLADVPLVTVDVLDPDGELVAGVLGAGRPPWLHYHLGGVAEAGRGAGASHLALHALACSGREQGFETLHLGGGVGGRSDSLLQFKQRFAPGELLPSVTARAVHDHATYARLTGSDRTDWHGFFPAYRAAY